MYRDVYWHKTVRACDSMFKRLFYEFSKNKSAKQTEKLLNLSDEIFISQLDKLTRKNKKLNKLIQPFVMKSKSRELYKPAYIYYYNEEMEDLQRCEKSRR